MKKFKKIRTITHEGGVSIFIKKRFLFIFWKYCKFTTTKTPVVFNHEYNADAYIKGIIEYREMSGSKIQESSHNKMDATYIATPYSKINHLLRVHKNYGLSLSDCEEIYNNALENDRGEKYSYDMINLGLKYEEKEPNVLNFLVEYMNKNEYIKSLKI